MCEITAEVLHITQKEEINSNSGETLLFTNFFSQYNKHNTQKLSEH